MTVTKIGGCVQKLLAMAALAVVSVTTGCSDGPTGGSGNDGPIPFQEVFKDRYSRIEVQRGEAISTPVRWQAVWDEITTIAPPPALPIVDFDGTSVLLAAMGENPDACWTVEIEGVRSEASVVYVSVANIRSPQSCSCPPVIVQPVHVVSVEAVVPSAMFDVRTVTRGPECN